MPDPDRSTGTRPTEPLREPTSHTGYTTALGASALALSYVCWAGMALAPASGVYGGAGVYSDHASHIASVLIFRQQGWRLFTTPVGELCAPVDPAHPTLGCYVDGDPSRLVVHPNWRARLRPYPPGHLGLFAAPALALDRGWLDHAQTYRATLLALLAFAHALIAIVARLFASAPRGLRWSVVAVTWAAAVPWAATGFYDPVPLCLVAFALAATRRGRHEHALLALSSALLLHYRALWLSGLALVLVVRAAGREGPAAALRRLALPIGLVTVPVTLSVWQMRAMSHFPLNNALRFGHDGFEPLLLALCAALSAALLALCALRRRLVPMATTLGVALFCAVTPQFMDWHSMWLLAVVWAAAPRTSTDPTAPAWLALALCLVVSFGTMYGGLVPLDLFATGIAAWR